MRAALADVSKDKNEITLRKLRTYRVLLCSDFCEDVLAEVYCDAIKLQMLLEND